MRSASSPPTSRVPPRKRFERRGVGVVAAGARRQVRPRREELPGAGDDHGSHVVIGIDLGERFEQAVEHL